MTLIITSFTETNQRPDNQDAMGTAVTAFGRLFVVCDGMGGALGGAYAAQYVVKQLGEAINSYRSRRDLSTQQVIVGAVNRINLELYTLSQEEPQRYCGMGTTLVGALETPAGFLIFHVGDSRAYVVDRKGVNCLTRDHTLVRMQVDAGMIPPEAARTHPKRSVLTRAVATEASVEVDFHQELLPLLAGQSLLLLSDGMWSGISEQTMQSIVVSCSDPEAVPKRLLYAGVEGGSKDNATCVIVHRPAGDEQAPPRRRVIELPMTVDIEEKRKRRWFFF